MKLLRDIRQEEFAEKYIKANKNGILNLCPRFGKCRVAITIMKKLGVKNVLIAYPDKKVEASWKEEFKIMKFKGVNIQYTTYLSLKKHIKNKYDLVILDEIHLLSEAQIGVVQGIKDKILGLTGTMSYWTERTLGKSLGLNIIASYPMEKAIEEGVITDYTISVVKVGLDNVKKVDYKGKLSTEKAKFDAYGHVINKLEAQKKETFFLRLSRMRLIQGSIAKLEATKNLLSKFKDERVLVFCGIIKIAESIGCPVFHSKKKDQAVFDNFSKGKGNHMAVIKIGNTGVTYKPLNRVIINYFDSNSENLTQKINRCMAVEYSNPDKKADVWIITSNEQVELKWLEKSLEFFDKSKIRYYEPKGNNYSEIV